MMNLHSIFCKVNANCNRLFVLLEPREFLSVPALYLAIFEQGGSAYIFSYYWGGGEAEMTLLRAL